MLMTMYSAPPYPLFLDGVGNSGEICSRNPLPMSGLGCPACAPMPMSGLRGDPFGITDIAGGIMSYFNTKAQADAQKKAIQAQIAEAKMQANEQAVSTAESDAQAQVATASGNRNSTMYALYAIGGVATIVGVAFLLSAMKKGGK